MEETSVFSFYGEIKVDSSGAVKSINDVKEKAKELVDGDIGKISVEFERVFKDLEDSARVDFSGVSSSIKTEMSEVEKEVAGSVSELRNKFEELKSVDVGLDLSRSEGGVRVAVDNIIRDIEELRKYVDGNGVSDIVVADLELLEAEVIGFEGALDLGSVIGGNDVLDIALDNLNEFVDESLDMLEDFGKKATLFLTLPIVKNAKDILPKVLDEDDARRRLENMSGIVGDEMEELEGYLKEAARDTGTEVAELFRYAYDSASGGVSEDMLGEFTEYVDKVAVVTGTSGDLVSNVLTTMSTVFDASVGDMADQLLKLEKIGKNSMEQLSSHLGKVMPSASRAGESLQGMNTSLAVLTQSGQSVARATTHLKNIYEEFGDKYSEVNRLLVEETGSTYGELIESGYTAADIFSTFSDIVDDAGMSMGDLFGESATFFDIIVDNADLYNEKFEEMSEATGELEADLDNLNSGPMQEYKITLFEVKEAFKALWEASLPVLQDVGEVVVELSRKFQGLEDSTQENIIKTVMFAGVLGPLTTGFAKVAEGIGKIGGKLIEIVGKLGVVKEGVGGLVAVLGGSKVAIVAGITLVVGLVGYLAFKIISGNEKLKLSFEKLFIEVQVKFRKFLGGIAIMFFNLVDKIGEAGAKIFGYDYEAGNSRMRQFADETEAYVEAKRKEQDAIQTKITMIKAEEVAAKKAKESRARDARFEERERQKKLKESFSVGSVDYKAPTDVVGGVSSDDVQAANKLREMKRLEEQRERERERAERKRVREQERLEREAQRERERRRKAEERKRLKEDRDRRRQIERQRKLNERERVKSIRHSKSEEEILKERLRLEEKRLKLLKKEREERDRLRLGEALVDRYRSTLSVVSKADRYRFEGKLGDPYEKQRLDLMEDVVNTLMRIEKTNDEISRKELNIDSDRGEDIENLIRVVR